MQTDSLLAGDILHMEGVVMEAKTENGLMRWKMTEHSAIVYQAFSNSKLQIAEQNFNKIRKVTLNNIDLANLKSGTITAFRPQPK